MRAVLIAIVAVLGLAACGGADQSDTDSNIQERWSERMDDLRGSENPWETDD